MNVQDRIRKAHVAIMSHKKWCAFSMLLACGKVEVRDDCPTAFTDGWNVTYGSKFVNGLTDPQIRLLVLHENTHKAYRHLTVYKDLSDIDRKLANIAMDHFVNLSLTDTDGGDGFIEMPECGIQPNPEYRGWSVKQIFDHLREEQESGGDGEGGEKPEDGDDEGNGGNGGGNGGGDGGGMDSHDWDNASSGDDKQDEARAKDIERAIRQGDALRKKMQGKGAGDADGVFGDLLKSKINWRDVLRQFLTATCSATGESTWSKPNRRMLASGDVYMPGDIGKTARHLVVVFDTSSSCFGTAEMTAFVSEMTSIVKTVKPKMTTALYVDWAVQGKQQFTNGQIAVQNITPKGGGGTDMTVGFKWCTENRVKPDAMIILTDGYTPFGQPPGYPVLWAITTDVIAPFGTTINIEV